MPDGSRPAANHAPEWLKWHVPVPPLDETFLSEAERSALGSRIAVLINGPQRSGKDTAATHLMARWGSMARWGMSYHLKESAHALYGLFDAEGRPLPHDHFEAVKDLPRPEFGGLTPRQAYIAVSETYTKPIHGPKAYGVFWSRRAARIQAPVINVPDAGFRGEWDVPLAVMGVDRLLLIRVHAEGRGVVFQDSRSYIDLPGVATFDVENNVAGDPSAFLHEVEEIAEGFLAGVLDPDAGPGVGPAV